MKNISNIIFTKNRPLQLNAYLEGLYRHFSPELFQTYILYKRELFEEEYRQLFCKYPDCIVIEENSFYDDFLKIIIQINTKYILFGVDDVVYFDSVDFGLIDEVFDIYSDDIFGFSLRLGRNVVENGKDEINDVVIKDHTIHKVNWNFGKTPNTRYPFELCATIYRTSIIKKIIDSTQNNNPVLKKLFSPDSALIRALGKITSVRLILKRFGYFYSPNTLESWVCRWCQNHSEQLPNFFYFQKLCASAIQVNMVNTSTVNEAHGSGEHTVEALAEKYKEGYRFDVDAIKKNKPTDAHCGPDYFSLIKNQ
jgi:hypothetical protein